MSRLVVQYDEVFESLHERVVEIANSSSEQHIKAELAKLALDIGMAAAITDNGSQELECNLNTPQKTNVASAA